MENLKTRFILLGFSQIMGSRVFEFQSTSRDSMHVSFTIGVDLALARKYGVHLQELPLLCRGILELRSGGEQQRAFALTEEEIRSYANSLIELQRAKDEKRKRDRNAESSDRA